MWEYQEYEAKLAYLHDIDPEDVPAFAAKLKSLRMAGVPKIATEGKGKRLTYTHRDLWETHMALTLVEAGWSPVHIVQFMDHVRDIGLLSAVSDAKSEVFLIVSTYINPGKSADYASAKYYCELKTLGELENYFRNISDTSFKLVLDISELTRETKI